MKKNYLTPTIMVEMIELSTSFMKTSYEKQTLGTDAAYSKVIVDDPSYREAGLKEDIWE